MLYIGSLGDYGKGPIDDKILYKTTTQNIH